MYDLKGLVAYLKYSFEKFIETLSKKCYDVFNYESLFVHEGG